MVVGCSVVCRGAVWCSEVWWSAVWGGQMASECFVGFQTTLYYTGRSGRGGLNTQCFSCPLGPPLSSLFLVLPLPCRPCPSYPLSSPQVVQVQRESAEPPEPAEPLLRYEEAQAGLNTADAVEPWNIYRGVYEYI